MAIIDVVKYDGNLDVFAWKYPGTELSTWTQLIVNESQEAILVKGGQICDVFGPGRHVLDTANIPILNIIVNLPFGGQSPFKAEVWFINKVFSLNVKWGTPTPIQLQDPKYKIFVPVRAYGQFGVKVEESKKFLLKLIGTLPRFDKATLVKYFRGVYLTRSKDAISSYLVKKGVSILEINAYLDEISSFLEGKLTPTFDEYGIRLVNFFVNDISVPEDDSGVRQLKDALAKKAEMEIVGYNYQQERSFDTLEGAATNPGSMHGDMLGAGIGLGMGVGMGGAIGQQFGGISKNLNIENEDHREAEEPKVKKSPDVHCAACGAHLRSGVKFCPACGKKYNPCHKCGADLPDGATACPECGERVQATCPDCGHLVDADWKFCPECGRSLVKVCRNCGATLRDGVKFCPECGTSVE